MAQTNDEENGIDAAVLDDSVLGAIVDVYVARGARRPWRVPP